MNEINMKKIFGPLLATAMCFCGTAASVANETSIGIVAAMESEISAIKNEMIIEETLSIAGLVFCCGKIGKNRAVVVQCGMGKVNAALATQILIDRFAVNAIINVGCAGSLNDALDIGDFVVSSEVVQHDYDVSAIGFEKGEIPYTGMVSFAADAALIAAAQDAITAVAPTRKIVTGRICTGDQFISADLQKGAIIADFGGECAEMEGAAVGQTAFLNGVSFVIIRAMSDKASSAAGSSDFTLYQEQVSKEGAEVVIEMVNNLQL